MNKHHIPKHETLVGCMIVASVLFALCSFIPYGPEEGTGILQGIATGIFTGVVLLLINGVKKEELRDLEEQRSVIKEISDALGGLYHIYGVVYHRTYHGKKKTMGIVKYHDLLMEAYQECVTDWTTIDTSVEDSHTMDMLTAYGLQIELCKCGARLESKINEIYTSLDSIDCIKADYSDLDKIRTIFCELGEITESCEKKMSQLLITVDDQIKKVDHSLF